MTTRLGGLLILTGIAVLAVRALGVVNGEQWDIGAVLAIVLGALGVAIDGEAADRGDSPG
ncbi:MAG: hypothetical protein JWN67_4743 [Actinomycetia bacterium]|nr:hypothetical protein [Actinomycetes bacterium]